MKKMALVLALAVVGCSSASEEQASSPEEASFDPAQTFSSDGLTVERSDADHVEGVFTRDGATLRFHVSREGTARRMLLVSLGGDRLLESTYADGVDTSIYFGGRAKATGRPNEEPKREGDDAVFEELAKSDARIFPQLKEALIAAKVDAGLFSPSDSATESAARPQMYQTWGSDGNYWTFLTQNGDWWGFWSWSGWGVTTVIMGNGGTDTRYGAIDWNAFNTSGFSAHVQAGCCSSETVSGYGYKSINRYWWGAYIKVTNKMVAIGGCYWKQVQIGTQCTAWSSGTVCSPVYTHVWTCDPMQYPKLIVRKI